MGKLINIIGATIITLSAVTSSYAMAKPRIADPNDLENRPKISYMHKQGNKEESKQYAHRSQYRHGQREEERASSKPHRGGRLELKMHRARGQGQHGRMQRSRSYHERTERSEHQGRERMRMYSGRMRVMQEQGKGEIYKSIMEKMQQKKEGMEKAPTQRHGRTMQRRGKRPQMRRQSQGHESRGERPERKEGSERGARRMGMDRRQFMRQRNVDSQAETPIVE